MDRGKIRVIFDTSGLNELRDDAKQEVILEKLGDSYEVLISETSVVELSATKDPEQRKRLVDVCERLLPFGKCLMPHNWIAEEMPKLHARYKDRFRWEDVDISAPTIEDEIRQREFLSQDSMAEESRLDSRSENQRFINIFKEAPNKFEPDAVEEIKALTLKEFIGHCKAENGAFWRTVAGWYKRARLIELDESGSREFIEKCPPFHALALGPFVGDYQHGIPRDGENPKYDAGRNDLFMAVYLPYCDQFITDDPGQQNALRAIATEVSLGVRILGYPEFRAELLGVGIESANA